MQSDSYIEVSPHATVLVGPDAMAFLTASQLKAHIRLYMRAGIVPTRGVGIMKMLQLAHEITKHGPYRRAQAYQAVQDLSDWCATMKAALPIEVKA